MNPLDILKSQLTDFLKDNKESEDFNEAIEEAIYACNLNSVVALEQWIANWIEVADDFMSDSEYEYSQGVWAVEEQWNKITGMF